MYPNATHNELGGSSTDKWQIVWAAVGILLQLEEDSQHTTGHVRTFQGGLCRNTILWEMYFTAPRLLKDDRSRRKDGCSDMAELATRSCGLMDKAPPS